MSLKNLLSMFAKQAKWVRVSTYIIFSYLIYALILGVITPLILQSQMPSLLSDKLGRAVNFEKVRINPFLLRVRVSDFTIAEEHSDEAFTNVKLFEVDAGFWQTVVHFTPTVEHIFIDEPYAHLSRTSSGEQTRFNFTDIIETLNKNAKAQTQEEEDTAEIPHIKLGVFRLSAGHVLLSDKVTGTDINYPELAFELTDLDTHASISLASNDKGEQLPENQYGFTLLTDEGGTLHFDGQFQLSPLEVNGSIALQKIALAPLSGLSKDLIEAKLTNGLLDLDLNYELVQHNDDVRFRVTNANLGLSTLAVADAAGQPKIAIENIKIEGISLDTETQQVDINNIQIDAPWVDASINDSGVDLATMFTPHSALDETPTPGANVNSASMATKVEPQLASQTQQASDPATNVSTDSTTSTADSNKAIEPAWRVILQSFTLNDGDIEVQESVVSQGVHWRVFDLNASTGLIDTTFEHPIDYTLQLGLGSAITQRPERATGNLASHGLVHVKQQQLTGMIEFGQFALSQLQPYLSPYVNATLKQGSAGVSGNFEVNADQSIVFNGQANVSSLTVEDGVKQEPLLEWQDMQVSGIDYRSEENAFSVAKVELKKPYAKLIIDSTGQTNVSDIVVQQTDVESTNAAKEHSPQDVSEQQQESSQSDPLQQSSSAMAIRIDEISLLDGSAYFEDNSLRPRFASGIEALNGAITGLASSGESPADVNIEGKIDGYAPVALSGAINPLLEEMYLDLHFSVSGAELTSVNPYSGTYMGHFIDKGLLSLDVDYSLENNQLEGQNHVVIDQLTLGRKTDSDQALSLPLGLAIALLQDSDGVIDLGMEVSGDLNNPSFGFGAIIFKAIGNLITKAVTAPFSFLANLVGSDDELNEIAFPDGSAELSDDKSEKLTTLAQALAKRPGLRVNIEGTVDEVEDAYELAEQKVQQQLLALSAEQALPADLSSSTLALASPFGEALSTLFTTSTNKQVDEERQVVKMRLEQSDSSEANEQSVVSQEQVDQALVIAMYNQVRSSINISRRELGNLADSRAKAVKTFLVNSANVDTKRLFLLNSRQHLQRDKSGVTLTLEAN